MGSTEISRLFQPRFAQNPWRRMLVDADILRLKIIEGTKFVARSLRRDLSRQTA